jgi:N-acetylmuramoyl-L-alanine amidase
VENMRERLTTLAAGAADHVASGLPILWVGSPNFGYPRGAHGRQGQRPLALVIHVAEGSLSAVDAYFQDRAPGGDPSRAVSAQFCVGQAGELHQYVGSVDASWGAGELDPGYKLPPGAPAGVNPNLWTISIEHAGWSNGFWTAEQLAMSLRLQDYLCAYWRITPSLDTIIPHAQLAPINRANCPGANYPMTAMINVLRSIRGLPPA